MSNLPTGFNRALSASYSRDLPKYFTYDEAMSIIYSPRRPGKHEYVKRFLCYLLWQTGARITEALNVKLEDMEPYAGVIHIETKKRKGHIRTLPKKPEFFNEVGLYARCFELERKDTLFSITDRTARRWVKDVCAVVGMTDKRAHPHAFRHSFAINCLLNGAPITVVKDWLGHADITKTMIYLKVIAKDTRGFMDKVEF